MFDTRTIEIKIHTYITASLKVCVPDWSDVVGKDCFFRTTGQNMSNIDTLIGLVGSIGYRCLSEGCGYSCVCQIISVCRQFTHKGLEATEFMIIYVPFGCLYP